MSRLIDSIRRGVPVGLEEIAQLGRTLLRRRNALGFRNITHYSIRSLLHGGALHALVNALCIRRAGDGTGEGVFWACIGDLFGVGDDDDLTDEGVFHGGVKEKIGDVCAGC
jgi:hypothetical protein